MNPIFSAKVNKGKLTILNQEKFDIYLMTLGEDVEIIIRKPKIDRSSRSTQQNRYYHGVIIPILSEELGYSKEEIHEVLKSKFLSKNLYIETKHGSTHIRVVKSTASLDTLEMEKYLSDIRQWSSIDLGIFIPLPNEVNYEENA